MQHFYEWLSSTYTNIPFKELISAFIGAVVGGRFTMKATNQSHTLQQKREAESEQEITKNTIKLIRAELLTAWQIYSEEFKEELYSREDGAPYLAVLPIGDNVFPLYDSSPVGLAKIPSDLSEKIVRAYMRAKGLIKMIELNNKKYEMVIDHANKKVQEKALEYSKELLENPNILKKIEYLHDQEMLIMAKYLNMGPLADGMKSLSLEIESLINSINSEVEILLNKSGH
ncbi:hypothetical protein [Pseudomonas sp.]|uniref:hypothetical protein n=1 Tax=Pseudomonas sp. TaxID=306 RepID=UPI00289BA018|nr:hypothetical protein [Pseudomonas sp.]